MARPITRDIDYAECYGCGQQNERGLRMTFLELETGLVESRYAPPDHFRGPPGVIHGGVQATLLDEVMGMAVESALGRRNLELVTASFSLRYRAPAPTGGEVLLRGRFDRSEGDRHFVTGELLDAAGTVCTTAEARWVDVSGR